MDLARHPGACTVRREVSSPDRRDLMIATILFATLLVLFVALRQRAYWGDARHLISMVERGALALHHVLYLPVARGFCALLAPALGRDPENALFLLSATAGACTGAVVYLAAREISCPRLVSAAACFAVSLSPGELFYATAIEVHALQAAVASAAVLWACRASRRSTLSQSALPPAAGFVSLAGAHMTGYLWGPALGYLSFSGKGCLQKPKRLAPALLLVLVLLVAQVAVHRQAMVGAGVSHVAIQAALASWHPQLFLREFVVPLGVLFPASLLLALYALWRRTLPPLGLATFILVGCFVPFAFTLDLPEWGGYYLSLQPVLGVAAACGATGAWGTWPRPLFIGMLLLLLVGEAWWSLARLDRWQNHYAGRPWVEGLQEDLGPNGLVLVAEKWEAEAVAYHSRLRVLSPSFGTTELDLRDPSIEHLVLGLVDQARRAGSSIAVLESVRSSQDPDLSRLFARLYEHLRERNPIERQGYVLFKAHSGGAGP